MNFYVELSQFLFLIFIFGYIIFNERKSMKCQKKLELDWQKFKEQRKELYKRLADPEFIEAEMEKGARLREMKDANRTTLPREDAGPPAVVYRPPLRGAKPGSWRPRNPGSPSVQ